MGMELGDIEEQASVNITMEDNQQDVSSEELQIEKPIAMEQKLEDSSAGDKSEIKIDEDKKSEGLNEEPSKHQEKVQEKIVGITDEKKVDDDKLEKLSEESKVDKVSKEDTAKEAEIQDQSDGKGDECLVSETKLEEEIGVPDEQDDVKEEVKTEKLTDGIVKDEATLLEDKRRASKDENSQEGVEAFAEKDDTIEQKIQNKDEKVISDDSKEEKDQKDKESVAEAKKKEPSLQKGQTLRNIRSKLMMKKKSSR